MHTKTNTNTSTARCLISALPTRSALCAFSSLLKHIFPPHLTPLHIHIPSPHLHTHRILSPLPTHCLLPPFHMHQRRPSPEGISPEALTVSNSRQSTTEAEVPQVL